MTRSIFSYIKLGNNNKEYIDGIPTWTLLQDCVDDTDNIIAWNIGASICIIICFLMPLFRFGSSVN